MTKYYLFFALVAFGCGRSALPYEDSPTGNAATAADLAPPADLAPAPPAETCGQILTCLIGCGSMQSQQCLQSCLQNVDGPALSQAGGVLVCAAESCASQLQSGSGINPLALFVCLSQNCSTALKQCDGLSFPGLGGGPPPPK